VYSIIPHHVEAGNTIFGRSLVGYIGDTSSDFKQHL